MRGIKWTMRDKERHGVVFNRAFRTPRMTLFKIIIVLIYDVYNNNYVVNPRYDVQEDNFMQVMPAMGSNMNKTTWCAAISHERDERNTPASGYIGRTHYSMKGAVWRNWSCATYYRKKTCDDCEPRQFVSQSAKSRLLAGIFNFPGSCWGCHKFIFTLRKD